MPDQLGQQLARIRARRCAARGASRAAGLRGHARVVALVVVGFVEAHGERIDGARRVARGDGGREARIDAAAAERAERHVGHELARHGAIQRRIERVDRLRDSRP